MELALATLRIRSYSVALWLHTDVDPPKDEWNVALDHLIAETKTMRVDQMRHLVISDGAAPSTAQRSRMNKELARDQPLRLAVITTVLSNPIKRGVATALSWANPQIKFFQPAQAHAALAHVDLADDVERIWNEYVELQSKLPPVKILEPVANALHMRRATRALAR
jgi:hypothetical protein